MSIIIEPFKIKSVEPLRFTSREEREAILKNAGYKARFLNDKVAFIKDQPICCFKE